MKVDYRPAYFDPGYHVEDCEIGKDVVIGKFSTLYKCTIGDGTRIGRFVEIQEKCFIGKNCRIGSYCFIPEGVVMGDNVFLGPRVTLTNHLYPHSGKTNHLLPNGGRNWRMRETVIGSHARIGASVTLLPVRIGEGALIGAGALVTKDIPSYTLAYGVPCKIIKSFKEGAYID